METNISRKMCTGCESAVDLKDHKMYQKQKVMPKEKERELQMKKYILIVIWRTGSSSRFGNRFLAAMGSDRYIFLSLGSFGT